MKKHMSTFMMILILLLGLSLLLYPTFSDYWNSMHQSRAIASYAEVVAVMKDDGYEELLDEAYRYNTALALKENPWAVTEDETAWYNQILNISNTGIMGYIEIPSLKVALPLYHGTEENVLQIAIGHLEWTSLPVGGESSHCVVSGHRGLPSARLFTDLDQLKAGDTFIFRILDETLTYEVDQIKIVEPHVTEDLLIVEGEDLVTLVTCTPYGINTHRMLVRGHRIETQEVKAVRRVTADAIQIEPVIVAPFVAVPLLLILLIALLIPKPKKRKEN